MRVEATQEKAQSTKSPGMAERDRRCFCQGTKVTGTKMVAWNIYWKRRKKTAVGPRSWLRLELAE